MTDIPDIPSTPDISIRLIIDNNEKGDIKDIFKSKGYEFRTLPLGDYLFERIDHNNVVTPLLLIERKTETDLANSIQSGRYRNQKIRMMSQDTPIAFLIEGHECTLDNCNDTVPNSSIKKSTITSAVINCIIRDKITVYRTSSVNESVYLLETLIQKLIEHDTVRTPQITCTYIETIKQKKGDNMTPSLCYKLQLSQIPGVSVRIAELIVAKYGSMRLLMDAYNQIDVSKRPSLLTDIKGIGKVLSKRVYDYLYNC
jgi:ERCC4-type nuclease